MRVITIKIPAPTSVLAMNLLGALGLVAIVVAVAGLAGVWWAVLTGGVALVGLSVIASTHLEQAEQPAARPVAVSRSSA
ncbi:MAG: hypothetical protein ACRDRZ_03685 [Pseudonocardiaceae bacterium]